MNSENQAIKQFDTNKPLNPESDTNIWLPNYESTDNQRMTQKAGEMISDQFRNLTESCDKTSETKDLSNNFENFNADSNKPLNPENGTNVWLPNYESASNKGITEKASEVFSNTKESISNQFKNVSGNSDMNPTTRDLSNNVENFQATTQFDANKRLNPENGTNIWLPNYESTNNKGIKEKAGEMFSNAKEVVSDQFRNLTGNSDKNSTNLSNNPENFHGTVQSDPNKPLNPENGTNIWLPNYENTNNKRITERAGEMISNVKENISNQWKNLTGASDQSITTTIPSQNLSNNAENLQGDMRQSDTNKSLNPENLQGDMRQSDTNKSLNPENGANVWLPNYEQSSS